MPSLGKTQIYLNITRKLLRIKSKGELLKGHQGHIIGETHCLPHKPVVRDEKATTKLQIVFDVSAKANESC